MDLSSDLINTLIGLALSGLGGWLVYLQGKISDVRERCHDLEVKIANDYAKKEELRAVVMDALSPLRDAISELKTEFREELRLFRKESHDR